MRVGFDVGLFLMLCPSLALDVERRGMLHNARWCEVNPNLVAQRPFLNTAIMVFRMAVSSFLSAHTNLYFAVL